MKIMEQAECYAGHDAQKHDQKQAQQDYPGFGVSVREVAFIHVRQP